MKGKHLVTVGLLIIVLGLALICYPIYAISAIDEVPQAEEVGLPSQEYYRIDKFDGDLAFDVSWNNYGCTYKYIFRCVDGYAVDPPPVGRLCIKAGAQKLNCDIAVPGIQKAHDYQEIRWVQTVSQVCHAFLPKLKLCPPCPVCEPEQQSACAPDGCQ